MSLRTRRSWAVLASLLFVASACTQGGTPGGAQPTPTGPVGGGGAAASPGGAVNLFGSDYKTAKFKEGQNGGTLIFADWQEANLFNPFYQGQVTEANLAAITFNGLVTTTYDFKYAPDLAAEIPTLDNGGVKVPGDAGDAMTVTWKLLDGLKFSDGEALGCSDVKFTHGWVMDPGNVGLYAGKSGYEDISSVECRSETDMVWHFKNIYEGYITLFSPSGGTILPEHYASKISIKDIQTGKGYLAAEMARVPVTGPFKFQSVTPKQEIRLIRNDNFKSSTFHGPPYLDTFVFKWYADADAMIAAYKGGSPEYDVATDLNDADLPKLTDIQDQVHQLAGLTYEFLRPNWSATTCSPRVTDRGRGCPMSDPAMREALKYA
jgi:peptide/nickel transport system substrate-binding protein